ncbi:UDP-N-acetylglucosamine transferase subunit ALG14 homolog [Neocloeon triangulifer]|uniref:UDP-N-acetylglucosamine transferase subunit ALG14 homolog n=1 Tax=Neocloeon triangulifer TaxID=2078957 RepID=UPI00286FA184|nr:UDP-N-acetylglucosamine transferase subunit ALG14 homolog [Neocloeon triangulifer]
MILLLFVSCVFLVLLRLTFTIFLRFSPEKLKCVDGVAVVIGSGGHTAEMLRMLSRLDPAKFRRRVYLIADSDTSSPAKVLAFESGREDFQIQLVPRMRVPLQSWTSALLRAPRAFAVCLKVVLDARPKLVLCNGPGTCVPVIVAAILLEALLFRKTQIVFIESICRVQTLSLSGRLLYYLLWRHQFLVQWPELVLKYPRATYIGQLV